MAGDHDPVRPGVEDVSLPVLVEVTRDALVESRHRGAAAVADARGKLLAAWGDPDLPVYPRSAVKPLQALPLVETGALDAFGLGERELALACASHGGQPVHTEAVAGWLARIGCDIADLECGSHEPSHGPTALALAMRGEKPSALHNNCSGKHAGFLTTARHLGEPLLGYVGADHPVQLRVRTVLEQMTLCPLADAPRGTDGCSIPTFAIPLRGLAIGMARLGEPGDLPDSLARSARRVRAAWGGHPMLIAGDGRLDTALIGATAGSALIKTGAEGVYCACLPERGIGVALKIEDGATRAAQVAIAALLRHLGALPDAAWAELAALARPPVRTRRGPIVGEIRPAAGFPA